MEKTKNQKSKDYSNIKDIFRPGHADFTYFHKYGIRDYRGGGRSSARETAARVAAGAVAKMILKALDIEVLSGVIEIGGIRAQKEDFEYAKSIIDPYIKENGNLKAIIIYTKDFIVCCYWIFHIF